MVLQLAMGLFNLGFITTYMSDPMIGGFTTGAAVHVGTSQVKYLFGLKIPRSDGVFQIVRVSSSDFNHKIGFEPHWRHCVVSLSKIH